MFIGKLLKSGDTRTALMKKNILGSFLVKGWSGVVQLLLVPVTLGCLNKYEYGIWLTINALLIWVDQFDIGLGNGLRNRLAEALALGDKAKGQILVSTTLVMLICIIVPLVFILSLVIQGLDCYKLLNVDSLQVPHLHGILIASLAIVGGTFIFKFIGNVYLALQLPAINNLLIALGNTMSLLVVFVLSLIGDKSLLHVAIAYTLSPLLVYVFSYPITFTRYAYLRPSFRLFRKEELKGLLDMGVKFFMVQIAGLVLFASSNLIISNMFSPAEVTPYQIAYRYLSLSVMVFTLIAAPLWSASTDAYAKNDWDWINGMMKKMRKVMLGFFVLLVLMTLISNFVYKIWVGESIKIDLLLSGAIAFYQFVLIYSTCYSNVLFGIGKIRIITIVTIAEAVIYIPLVILLGKACGTVGIVLALTIVNFACAVTNRIQFGKLASGTATGIWDK